ERRADGVVQEEEHENEPGRRHAGRWSGRKRPARYRTRKGKTDRIPVVAGELAERVREPFAAGPPGRERHAGDREHHAEDELCDARGRRPHGPRRPELPVVEGARAEPGDG